jgi:hypothetical protein
MRWVQNVESKKKVKYEYGKERIEGGCVENLWADGRIRLMYLN